MYAYMDVHVGTHVCGAGADWTVGKSVIYRIKFTKKKKKKNEKKMKKKRKKKERKKINKRKNIKKENS